MQTEPQQTMGKTRDEIAAAYSSPPWWYDFRGFFILTFAYNSTLNAQFKFFGPHFGAMHLEAACGSGSLLDLLLRWRKWKKLPESKIIGFDYAESMLAGAIHRFKGNPLVEIQHADAAALPYPDHSFDTVNIANSIHCFPEIDKALSEIHRVLKPGGSLAANVLLYPRTPWPFNRIAERINQWGITKGILYTPYHQTDIEEKLKNNGFFIESSTISGNCLFICCGK
jgi:ubiquinone/menaquinone biosynthesis C-methylase UbiE